MANIGGDMDKKPIIRNMQIVQMAIAILALIGLLYFGLPSPESRPKIYELYLAGVWFLMTLSGASTYWYWKESPWSRKIMAVAAPLATLLYLQKYFFIS